VVSNILSRGGKRKKKGVGRKKNKERGKKRRIFTINTKIFWNPKGNSAEALKETYSNFC
jgi:hypothetical protein